VPAAIAILASARLPLRATMGAAVPTSWKSPIGRLRAVALAEGVSFLVLLGIAMPLKHLADMPLAVRIAGWIHGVLFIAVCFILSRTASELAWSRRQVITVVVAALLPFGPFVIDRRLARLDRDPGDTTSPPGT
jgi:integral membrane protein